MPTHLPSAKAARAAATRALVEIACSREASPAARVAAARAILTEQAATPVLKPKARSSEAPAGRVSVRSSPEAFRAYHRESMRRRRAAAKAAKEAEAAKPKRTANRRDPVAYREYQRAYMAKRRAAAKAALIATPQVAEAASSAL